MSKFLILCSVFYLAGIPKSDAKSIATAWADAHRLSIEKSIPTIESNLARRLSSLSSNESLPVMVFFTDKGIFGEEAYSRALSAAETALTPEARIRRTKTRTAENLVDFRDLPVYALYVEQSLSSGARLRQTLRWFNAISVEATPEEIKGIADIPYVRLIKSVAGAKTNIEISDSPIPPQAELTTLNYGSSFSQLDQINTISAHELDFKGQNVIICMMDVGYRQGHDAFQNIISSGRLIAQYDFINHDNNTDYDPAQDAPGQADHGTLTWSTLGGEASGHLYGPSYMARFVLSKTEDISSERHIEEDNWAAGAEWADSIGASVISASLGYRWFDAGQGDYSYNDLDGNTTIVAQAADMAAYNGIAVATAMGNEGNSNGSLISPADADSVIACGAVDSMGNMASFSSWGPTSDGRIKPEVCARGVRTICADPYNYQGYRTASGTSLSTPLIGGACGVLLSAHPSWTPMMVREALMMTADRADSANNAFGWGIIDVSRALYYHPEGDIIIGFNPRVFLSANESLDINAQITGGHSITSAFVYYRRDQTGDFTEMAMTTSDGLNFTAEIPGQPSGVIQYYLKANDSNGGFDFNPVGGAKHPFIVMPGQNIFNDSFENGVLCWNTGGANNSWGLCSRFARNGSLGFADSPTENYRNNTNSWVESTFKLDLSSVSAAALSFFYRGAISNRFDSLFVEASPDNGLSWQRIGSPITGSFSDWTQYNVSLNSQIGQPDVKIRLHFISDDSGIDDGIFIDDFQISIAPAPNISFSPQSIFDSVNAGEIGMRNIVIRNSGSADLYLNLQAVESGGLREAHHNSNSIEMSSTKPGDAANTWLFIQPESDTVFAADSLIAEITYNATSLPPGIYYGTINLISNDPDTPVAAIPITLTVIAPPSCSYVPGDANDNGVANGLDVTYSVNYLKGIGPEPPYICECPPHPQFSVAADANGDCAYNGLDISFMVNYLKGGGAMPRGCADCPGIGGFRGID